MEIWDNTYSAAQVAAAANIPPATLQNWMKRKVIVGHRDDDIVGGNIQGKHRSFSFFAVMQVAIANALIEAGNKMDIKTAFEGAIAFAHSDDAAPNSPKRYPGYRFHHDHGETVLACARGQTAIVLREVGRDTFGEIKENLNGAEDFVVINAGSVFDRVCTALGKRSIEVLDAAYSEDATD